jgi:hypothetical protein
MEIINGIFGETTAATVIELHKVLSRLDSETKLPILTWLVLNPLLMAPKDIASDGLEGFIEILRRAFNSIPNEYFGTLESWERLKKEPMQ